MKKDLLILILIIGLIAAGYFYFKNTFTIRSFGGNVNLNGVLTK